MNVTPPALPLTIITHEFFPMKGGIATFVEEMAQGCQSLGTQVEVWAPHAHSPIGRTFPFPVRRVAVRGTQDLRMAREMITHRRRLRHCMVYLAEPGPLLAMTYLQFFRAFKPAKLLLTFHGSEIQSFSARPAARMMVGQLIRAADRISTPSRFVRDLLVERFDGAANKTVVTHGAVRRSFVHRAMPPVRHGGKIVVLTVGRLHPRKGQHHVLDALDALPDPIAARVEYWIVGRGARGDYEARLRRRADQSKIPVTFLGNIDDDDLEHIYRRADIFAMTSVNHGHSLEGFGLAYLEAAAFGLPVIGHAVGGVPEAVRHGHTGILVSPDNPGGLSEALGQLIENEQLRRAMGENGRRWARSHSWDDSARTLLEGLAESAPVGVSPALEPAGAV